MCQDTLLKRSRDAFFPISVQLAGILVDLKIPGLSRYTSRPRPLGTFQGFLINIFINSSKQGGKQSCK